MPDISVVIATRNRAALLEPCLTFACEQTLDPSRYEICIVDNGSTDETPQIIERIRARYPRHSLRSFYEDQPGVCRARNRALAQIESDYVAITDDDVRVSPTWLEQFLARFQEFGDKLAIVGGKIDPIWATPKPDWLGKDLIGYSSAEVDLGEIGRFVNEREYFIECNSCYRRSALAKAGNFPEGLGRVGTYLLSGENVVEAHIKDQGGLAYYDPSIIVKHVIHAERLTPLWFRQRLFWQGVSGFAVREYQRKHGMTVTGDAFLNLPLKPEDWSFLNQDTADGLLDSVFYFQSLGFALALTGIIPVEVA